MYRLDLLVLNLKRLQEEFGHVDRFDSRCLARDLKYDGFQQLFPNDLRLNRFIEGTRSHFHLEQKLIGVRWWSFGTYIFGAFSLHLNMLFDGPKRVVHQNFGQRAANFPFVKKRDEYLEWARSGIFCRGIDHFFLCAVGYVFDE